MEIILGQVVKSKAGRDAGRIFIVVGLINDNYVIISDGDLRRLEKPKKKKIKHLEFTDNVIEVINKKIVNNLKITNSEIRKSLQFQDESNKSDSELI